LQLKAPKRRPPLSPTPEKTKIVSNMHTTLAIKFLYSLTVKTEIKIRFTHYRSFFQFCEITAWFLIFVELNRFWMKPSVSQSRGRVKWRELTRRILFRRLSQIDTWWYKENCQVTISNYCRPTQHIIIHTNSENKWLSRIWIKTI